MRKQMAIGMLTLPLFLTTAANAMEYVMMKTSLGDMVIELDDKKAPETVANFLRYVDEKYYEGTIFHRVIDSFMIQGGGFDTNHDKKTDGLHPPVKIESSNGLKNVRGSIAMARTGNPNSATSQFFINVVNNTSLDYPGQDGYGYTVFGKVVEGMDTVDKIRYTELKAHPKIRMGGPVTPVVPVVIGKVTKLKDYDPSKKIIKKTDAKEARGAKKPAPKDGTE